MSQTATPVPLSIQSVSKSYGSVQALKNVSFEMKPGEVFGLLGPNGAGKTSLISIVVTLEKATGGRVEVFGQDVSKNARDAKMHTGWVPQEVIHHGFFSVEEILTFHAGYFGVRKPQARIKYLLDSLGMFEHRRKKVKQLSGGMKRRLMIAKALIHSPGLLILDEPTAGVDVELRAKLWNFVEELKGQGMSILLTTHYLEEAERLCERVAIIHKGEIRALDQTRRLIDKWSRKGMRLKLVHPVTGLTHPDLVKGQGSDWSFLVPAEKSLGELLREVGVSANQVQDVQVSQGRLEDVFMKLTRNETSP
ncbi:MAG TPA: ABC transporter ATP-binding protein [Bdellovibrionales bacterium]|nr:ABC transporter ATP-binding protein [Bdellovibrionales bacterium]